MPMTLREDAHDGATEYRRRNVRTAIVLAVIAAAFYVGFIVMHIHGG